MARVRTPAETILRSAALLIILISNLPAIQAQENPPVALNFHRWGSITVFNGLPSDSVRAISQTPDGVLWFGTDNGLARFDGRRMQKITLAGSNADRVLCLKTSAVSGELWIGTSNGEYLYLEDRLQAVANTEGIGVSATLIDGADIFLG